MFPDQPSVQEMIGSVSERHGIFASYFTGMDGLVCLYVSMLDRRLAGGPFANEVERHDRSMRLMP